MYFLHILCSFLGLVLFTVVKKTTGHINQSLDEEDGPYFFSLKQTKMRIGCSLKTILKVKKLNCQVNWNVNVKVSGILKKCSSNIE